MLKTSLRLVHVVQLVTGRQGTSIVETVEAVVDHRLEGPDRGAEGLKPRRIRSDVGPGQEVSSAFRQRR